MTKICQKCEVEQPAESFSKSSRLKDGLHSWCRSCTHDYYLSRKEHQLHLDKLRRRKYKRAVYLHYGNGKIECRCCGETEIEFLSVDHVNNDGAQHRKEVSTADICKWLVNRNFPTGFQILCMNCNVAKGKFGICPHKRLPTLKVV